MTGSDDPDQIRREIERTQAHLSTDVDALTEKVTPGRIVARRVDRAKAAGRRLTDRVMGSDDPTPGRYDPYNPYSGGYTDTRSPRHAVTDTARSASANVSDAASSAAETISDTASSAAAAVQEAPQALRRQTQGNPLAAGIIAFGAGWLVSSLLPASRQEQRLAQQATEKAAEVGRPLADKAREAAMEVKDNLQEPAQQAVASVKDTATEAGRTVVDEGKSAAQDAHANTREAASGGDVRQSPPSATYPSPERR
ncbi:MAG TPA: DUF3618 domain-containing protein [Mycobacteriales bacterium]|nr:DUF3618 domain-containing protein [Mycobacteriales bacterium]